MRRVKEPRRTNVFQQIPDIEGDGFYEPPTPEVIGESDPQVVPFGDKRVVITTQDFIALWKVWVIVVVVTVVVFVIL